MRSTLMMAAVAALFFAGARPAHAQAWPVTHQWADQARPGDPTSGSFAYEYAAESVAIEGSMTATGEAFDCSKAAMTVVVRYAHDHGLPILFTLSDPANGWKLTTVHSTDARFQSYDDFRKLFMGYINAKTIALYNTVPIALSDLRGGDLSLMRWNQLGDQNPFYPDDVWHTYSWGAAQALLFYGNEIGADNHPAPVLASDESDRLAEATGQGPMGPALYGNSPRRWKFIDGQIVPPQTPLQTTVNPTNPEKATVNASTLNFRADPSATAPVIGQFPKGTQLQVEGTTANGWVRVRLSNGTLGYVSQQFVSLSAATSPFHIDQDAEGLTAGRFDHDTSTDTTTTQPAPAAPAAPAVQQPRTGITDAVHQVNDGGD